MWWSVDTGWENRLCGPDSTQRDKWALHYCGFCASELSQKICFYHHMILHSIPVVGFDFHRMSLNGRNSVWMLTYSFNDWFIDRYMNQSKKINKKVKLLHHFFGYFWSEICWHLPSFSSSNKRHNHIGKACIWVWTGLNLEERLLPSKWMSNWIRQLLCHNNQRQASPLSFQSQQKWRHDNISIAAKF